jgi:hypothetical protein
MSNEELSWVKFYPHEGCDKALCLYTNLNKENLSHINCEFRNEEIVFSSDKIIEDLKIIDFYIGDYNEDEETIYEDCYCTEYFFFLNLENLKCNYLKLILSGDNEHLYINEYPKECNNLDLTVSSLIDGDGDIAFHFVGDIFNFKNNISKNPLYNIKNKRILLSDDYLFPFFLENLKDKTLNIQSLINIKENEDIYILFYYALLKLNFKVSFYRNNTLGTFDYHKYETLDKFAEKICGIPVNKFVDTVDNLLELEEKHSIEF